MAASAVSTMQSLRTLALRLPDTEEGIACAGTSLESRTIKVGGKAFLFLRAGEARLKLGESLSSAAAIAAKDPEHVRVGAGGWVLLKFESKLALREMERWIAESHALFQPKSAGKRGAGPEKSKAARRGRPRS